MSLKMEDPEVLQFIHKTGYDIGGNMMPNIDLHYQKSFDFFPEFTMFFASYTVKRTFSRPTKAPASIENCLCFFFKNVFDDESGNKYGSSHKNNERPVVRVFPSTHSHISHFKKGTHRKIVSVFISADYLKSFLKEEARRFQFLFDMDNVFLIEEIMSDDILCTVNDIVKKEAPGRLAGYYYKLKALELLFYLFQSLSRREKSVHQKLNEDDIRSIYKVRDQLVSSLNKAIPITELKQIAGMNELKMRKIFTQIFGMGIYTYFQHFRMKEAARLIREEKLSVSEAGYRMGFENLSHFSRVFEKHIGKKPKKYSKELIPTIS